jgi:hypothetical protein
MPASLKTLYKSKGTTIKTTVLRDTPPPPLLKPQPQCPPLAAITPNSRPSEQLASEYTFDTNQWDINGEEGAGLLDSEDGKPRRLHQVGMNVIPRRCCVSHPF